MPCLVGRFRGEAWRSRKGWAQCLRHAQCRLLVDRPSSVRTLSDCIPFRAPIESILQLRVVSATFSEYMCCFPEPQSAGN
ncbi:hypothetical protein HBI56_182420 [Parastagonospora nodorum]|uniref:Uncharacterized protein n=1 Tax=Phaeosphaeria nodorum (strain SN15 / ATCC MYA-4574 / FGSC 10173) TaxID=321614 RepID=A0A7U2I5S8_PHANO|nr:hypothetical protein HBH56_187830 [Parastagonospora nodorum]QRD00937.1 hypothetical protein JI435_416010 [Parastagonospora nodorum SN15]KAH3925261.1 hypothetical protein HBH54_180740 [Parastagonospora nodorum]KAH3959167.1 hypothetical protein HBH52_246350 [Parastagonospora nodorum]KAH3991094.1 hypothetical protein HBI10_239090 [Parastagonospora nodorum]